MWISKVRRIIKRKQGEDKNEVQQSFKDAEKGAERRQEWGAGVLGNKIAQPSEIPSPLKIRELVKSIQ